MRAPNFDPGQRAQILAELQRITSGVLFRRADKLTKFLYFVVEQTFDGKTDQLKEACIAIQVYGRTADFDPRVDPIVRTEARRLRLKLSSHYSSDDSKGAGVRISLPAGGYLPVFEFETRPPMAIDTLPEAVPEVPALPTGLRRRRRVRLTFVAAGALAMMLVAAAMFFVGGKREEAWKSVRFTSLAGYQNYPALSPDGTAMAYSWGKKQKGPQHVYVEDLRSHTRTQLTFGDMNEIRSAWSPDSKELAYVEMEGHSPKAIYRIPARGGERRLVAAVAGRDPEFCNQPKVDWSPDGNFLVTPEPDATQHVCTIVLVDTRTGAKHAVTHPAKGVNADVEPAFSPDGKTVAFLRHEGTTEIYTVRATGGAVRRITFDHRKIVGFNWMPDGRSFVASSDRAGDFRNLWQLFLDGHARQLTNAPLYLSYPAVSRNGSSIAYVEDNEDANIWRFDGQQNAALLTSANWELSPHYSPDGKRIAFCSNRSGSLEIWIADADGQNEFRVTSLDGASSGSPAWSPDSKRLAFDVRADEQSRIYMAEAMPNSQSVKITNESGSDVMPSWSGDGDSIYFGSNRSGTWNIHRKQLSDGLTEQVTHEGGFRGVVSGDGEQLYFTKRFPQNGIWRTSLKSPGDAQCILPSFPARRWADWDLRGDTLYYLWREVEQGAATIRSLNLANRQTRLLGETAKTPTTDGFSASPDGRNFTYVQLDREGSNIFLLQRESK